MIQPQHVEFASHPDSAPLPDASAQLEASWYTLRGSGGGGGGGDEQELKLALELRIVPDAANAVERSAGAPGWSAAAAGTLGDAHLAPDHPEAAEERPGLLSHVSSRLGGLIEAQRRQPAALLRGLERPAAARGWHGASPRGALSPRGAAPSPSGSIASAVGHGALPVVEEGAALSPLESSVGGSSGKGVEDSRDGWDDDQWEDVSDTSSVSSTGSNYSDGHVGDLLSPSPLSAELDPDMGVVTVARPLSRDVSLRAGNLVLTVTVAELRGFGSAGLRKRLEAEWYVKLRLMKPAGRGWVLVDKPYRTEFLRPVPRGESADVVPISMRFKFPPGPSNGDEYSINEQLMRYGVLRFKVKAKRLFKFRTVVKSRCAPTASLHHPCNLVAGVLVQRRGAFAVLGRGFCRRRGPRGGGAQRRAVQWLQAVWNLVASRQVRRRQLRLMRFQQPLLHQAAPTTVEEPQDGMAASAVVEAVAVGAE